MSKKITYNRRHFLNNALMIFGAAELSLMGLGGNKFINQNFENIRMSKSENNNSFDQLKQINAGILNVGYAESGPADGPPVILLHG